MATIRVEDLKAGFDLISDEETYLNDLTGEELDFTKGGITIVITSLVVFSGGYAVGKALKDIFS